MDQLASPAGWVERLLGGEVPAKAHAVPARFQGLLRDYLWYLQTERKRVTTTLHNHGGSLIAFFVWLASNAPQVTMDTISHDHIASYLEHFRADGRVQGREARREGHQKAVRTMYSTTVNLRAFFAWAKLRRLCRTNPVEPFQFEWGVPEVHPLPETQVAELLKTWTDPSANPRSAAVGLLCLVYGLSTSGIANLPLNAVDLTTDTFHGLAVPVPIPQWLRPALERYLNWRRDQTYAQKCDYFVVAQRYRNYNRPANLCLFHRILRPYGVNVRQLRDTALAQTIQHGHLKLLTVFGLNHNSTRRYEALVRLIQNTRRVDPKPNLW